MRLFNFLRKEDKPQDDKQVSYRFLKSVIKGYAKRIDAPEAYLPTYGYSDDFAKPHIEIDKKKVLHYVVIERGKVIERKTTCDMKHLIFLVFERVTFIMSCDYELKHRVSNNDTRRIVFEKQVELLGQINDIYAKWVAEEHKKILLKSPFVDETNN